MHTTKPFAVNFWGSHPSLNNDDCHTGSDFETLAQAEEAFAKGSADHCTSHVELTGPGVYRVRENAAHDPKRRAREMARDDAEWQRERAMQAGMGLGCDGYNDEMGY
jgi:hypothetical protein